MSCSHAVSSSFLAFSSKPFSTSAEACALLSQRVKGCILLPERFPDNPHGSFSAYNGSTLHFPHTALVLQFQPWKQISLPGFEVQLWMPEPFLRLGKDAMEGKSQRFAHITQGMKEISS